MERNGGGKRETEILITNVSFLCGGDCGDSVPGYNGCICGCDGMSVRT